MAKPTVLKPTLFMAFDFGLARIGVAVGNAVSQSAQPIACVQADNEAARFAEIEILIATWQPEALVVGLPLHPDGSPQALTARCQRFARQLEGRFGLPCVLVDERYTSVVAEQVLGAHQARRNKGAVDMGSACLILQQYFMERP
jgi:putative Holliday junction resolvase